MAVPIIPWEPHVFPKEIQSELRRRSINRGMRPTDFPNTDWVKEDDDWSQYRGPMTAWVRVCSNGYGSEKRIPPMPGFVLYGGKDFYQSYGFQGGIAIGPQGNVPNLSIIGYTPDGNPHVIENDFTNDHPIHVPTPEIEKISANIQKELLRRIRIEWTCFSFKQLEYMTPYFLVPGISCIVEWGWNHFNPLSLLDLNNTSKLADYYNNPYPLYTENVLGSRGNYEVLFGIVTNFEWSIDGNKIRCVTEVTSRDRLWAGQVISSNMIEQDPLIAGSDIEKEENKDKTNTPIKVIDSLKKFVEQYLDMFKNLVGQNKTADEILSEYTQNVKEDKRPLYGFIQYLKEQHPDNFKEYLFGLFYGRDETTKMQYVSTGGFSPTQQIATKEIADAYADKDHDFDCQSPRANFWMNMGLIVEIINFFSSQLKGVKDHPMFKVDIDDCVISGHPNLISTNGDVLLIPNAIAPKYFAGLYGNRASSPDGTYVFKESTVEKSISEYQTAMRASSITVPVPKAKDLDEKKISVSLDWANYRLNKIVAPLGGVHRDNISNLINANRFRYAEVKDQDRTNAEFEFPFSTTHYDVTDDGNLRTYEAYYTGYLKNLYINAKAFKDIVGNTSVVKFTDVYTELFRAINSAASEFWDLKLMGSTGRLGTTGLATMKIVDNKLSQYTSNEGEEIFMFDYYAADGLLQQINFRPMLSNAQAIRTIYAQTNLTNKKSVVLSDDNELLDYKFKDRLFLINDQSSNKKNPSTWRDSSFKSSMEKLQALYPPPDKSFQMTTQYPDSGGKIIFRLAIPPSNAEVLTLMLDDNDKTHNPRYTGIMPGIQAEFTIQGISGIRTFSMFRVRGLPEPYSEENIVFRVINVNDIVQNGQWVTTIVAGVIPLRGYFRSKLRLPPRSVDSGQ